MIETTPARPTGAQVNPGDLVTYDGSMAARAMQRCRVVMTFRSGELALRFPDGAGIRVPRASVTKVIAPQHEPMW